MSKLNSSLLGFLNDLWRFRIRDLTWTWFSGNTTINHPAVYGEKGVASPTNTPGAREGAIGWYDNDAQEFWLFGGFGYTGDQFTKGT